MDVAGLAVCTRVAELRQHVAQARGRGLTIGLVPTMGALHAGHVSLVERSHAECGFSVATIFVNPTQFGPKEDFTRYPRTLGADCSLLKPAGCDLVFAPEVSEVYPRGASAAGLSPLSSFVDVTGVTEMLEGESRPGHFRGVATVVLKLFNMAQPDVAYFGRKDFQQATMIRRMVADLDVPVDVRLCPIVRDADGLALSSRNAYLSPEERRQALVLSQSLREAAAKVAAGERDAANLLGVMREVIAREPGVKVDYVALADPDTLQPVSRLDRPAVALLAARVGTTRLIDNATLEPTKP